MEQQWDIAVGEKLVRRDLHTQYGGAWYGGIEPSSKTPNVLLFTDARAGKKFGYNFDGWHPDGTFRYTGEGQLGDQEMRQGNRAIRDHLLEGRALRLFEKDGTSVTYLGEFEVPNESHVLIDEAPDREFRPRKVFVFRLRPVGEVQESGGPVAPPQTLYTSIPIEANNVETYVQARASMEPVEALRKEAGFVRDFVAWVTEQGMTVERQAIPTAAGHLMFTDAYVRETRELIEAKPSSSRQNIRLALGQILDYSRYVDYSSLAVLVPTRPSEDLIHLLVGNGVGCIWPSEEGPGYDAQRPVDVWS